MNRIRIFTDFCSTDHINQSFKRIWGDLPENWVLVNDDTYTHAIIMNTPMPALKVPKERVIGLAMEPFVGFQTRPHPFLKMTVQFVQYAQKHIGRYLLGAQFVDSTGKMPEPFEAKFSYLFHVAPPPDSYIPAPILPNKPLFSIMVSQKSIAAGHVYRHTLVKQLLKIPNFPIHVYGNGCKPYMNDPRVYGKFDDDMVMYNTYPFHICIENFQLPHYFSEKIINPMLCGCTPVYLGCSEIDTYIPSEGGILKLTGDVNQDIQLLYKIINNPTEYKAKHTPCRAKVREITCLAKHLEELF